MIEDAAFDALRGYLVKLAADSRRIDPGREALADVIRDAQGAPRPGAAYAMVEMLADRDLGEADDERYTLAADPTADTLEVTADTADILADNAGEFVVCRSRAVEFLIRVHVFARRPIDFARLFVTGLRTADAHVWLAPFAVREVKDISRDVQLVQQQWEGRAAFDVLLATVATEKLIVDVVETGNVLVGGENGEAGRDPAADTTLITADSTGLTADETGTVVPVDLIRTTLIYAKN